MLKYEIVQIGDPALRSPAKLLTKEEILSDEIQNLIAKMKQVMDLAPGVGLAAPQIGLSLQLVVIEDKAEFTKDIPEEILQLRERRPVPFHVLINPKIVASANDKAEFFEACLSASGLVGVVPRSLTVEVECLNEKAEPIHIAARGWYARILQHEIDHLSGILCLDRSRIRTLMTIENYVAYWKDMSVADACEALGA